MIEVGDHHERGSRLQRFAKVRDLGGDDSRDRRRDGRVAHCLLKDGDLSVGRRDMRTRRGDFLGTRAGTQPFDDLLCGGHPVA